MTNHTCGQCSNSFKSENAYLKHHCPTTQFNPKQPEHFNQTVKPASKVVFDNKHLPNMSENEMIAAVTQARQNKR